MPEGSWLSASGTPHAFPQEATRKNPSQAFQGTAHNRTGSVGENRCYPRTDQGLETSPQSERQEWEEVDTEPSLCAGTLRR